MMRPGQLYQRTKSLEIYFDGNPDAWFAADGYGPWLAQLRGMGVRDTGRPDAREPDQLGYVVIADQFARHERGVAGFDPSATLDGLEYALRHPNEARCEFVWNVLLVPNRHLVAGIVEKSHRQELADASRERARSGIGQGAATARRLPVRARPVAAPAERGLADLQP